MTIVLVLKIPNQIQFGLEKSLTEYSVLNCLVADRDIPLENLALLRGLCGALVSRGLKALFFHLSRALLRILSGALLCHLIMADFTLNIAAML